MSLSRVKTWIPGDTLTAADLNAEFDNVLSNPLSLISPSTGVINFNLKAHTNLLVTALSASSGSTGQVLTISSSGAGIWTSSGLTMSSPQTLMFDAASAVFTTSLFPGLVRSTQLQSSVGGVSMALAYDPSTMEKAYFTIPLTTQISAISSATLELWYSATSSGKTVWQVGSMFLLTGSSGGGASTSVSSTSTPEITHKGNKVSIGLVATSWATPGVLQLAVGRLSSDAGDASTGDAYLHAAALRIAV